MVFWVAAISAFCNLACAFAPTLPVLAAARFATGATVGAIVPLAIAWIGDVVPYEGRQAVLARFLIGHMCGIAAAATAAGWLGERFGWTAVFLVLAALYAAIALLLGLELRGNPATRPAPGPRPPLASSFATMASLLKRPWVRVVLVTVYCEGALFYGGIAFVAYDAHRRFGLGLGASGAMLAAFAAGGLVYAASAGRLLPRLGERGMVGAGAVVLGAGYLCLALAPSAAFGVPCVMALGAGLYMLHNTLQVHATQMAPEARGGALALFAFFLFTGQASGAWLASRVVDAAGTLPVFLVAAAGLPLLAFEFRRRLGAANRR
jgi:predicted MFS family arabinose efflux permease